ncbi:MAG TPA: nitronate monooxygenase, partial [Kiloniellales bacterium]|nr:nitronate monooxygenase [Kiloniellales bacterium]
LIGVGYLGQEWIDRQFAAAGNQRVGIGFITWYLEQHPEQFAAALAHQPKVLMFSFGDARPWIAKAKRAGARVICQVQSLAAAKRAAHEGADVIVAQGSEAGGHGGGRATLPLVPAIVDAISPTPVLAAGGIADGRGIAAALTLGASGALIGTRFIATQESLAHDAMKVRLVVASGDHTLRTRIFDIVRGYDWPEPWTGRALANEFTERWHGHEAELQASLDSETPRYWRASEAGDLSTALVWAGEGLDLIHDVPPASALVESLSADAERALAATAALRI